MSVIKVENVSKRYRIGVQEKADTFAGQLKNAITYPVRNFKRITQLKKFDNENDPSVFWALKDINFEVNQGEVLGIIGRNGAGKSTLLKVLSRITEPTSGQIKIKGRVSSLLEVGTGFHPELTGRDNVYMNGTILGMTKKEIDAKFDEIVDFSGVEQHIDTPVKFYSSGMKVRLGFSVAAHLEPEILIIDEVLAVGDFEFQKRCLGKMDDVAKSGRTVLFVSHNMASVRKLCTSALELSKGNIIYRDSVENVVTHYLDLQNQNISNNGVKQWSAVDPINSGVLKLQRVSLSDDCNKIRSLYSSEESIIVTVEYELVESVTNMRLNFQVRTKDDDILFSASTQSIEKKIKPAGYYSCTLKLPKNFFNQGRYSFVIQGGIPNEKELIKTVPVLDFQIEKLNSTGSTLEMVLPGLTSPNIDIIVKRND